MAHMESVLHAFHKDDEVVLVEGTYQGTLGRFVQHIAERNGAVRSHPVAWMGQAVGAARRSGSVAAAGLEPRIE